MSTTKPLLKSSISPNSFLHIPPPPSSAISESQSASPTIIFFIPGNPGLISYYHTFLSLLADPRTGPSTSRCVIGGFSLGGFEVGTGDGDGGKLEEEEEEEGGGFGGNWGGGARGRGKGGQRGLYSLRAQINLTAKRVERLVRALREQEQQRNRNQQDVEEGEEEDEGDGLASDGSSNNAGGGKWKVILVGHSVGAYIALEVLRMHRQRLKLSTERSSTPRPRGEFDITAAILLTPTVVDIALSASGRVVAPLLGWIPGFPLLVSWGAKLVTALLPIEWLGGLVRIVMGDAMSDEAVRSTVSFLRSEKGLRESLGMARDEMEEIGGDGWGEEVWGVVEEGEKIKSEDDAGEGEGGRVTEPAELVFYFAKRDHWVADQTREAIISSRGGKGGVGRPRMVVAEADEIVHGWCVRHNSVVAQRVDGWVEGIIKGR